MPHIVLACLVINDLLHRKPQLAVYVMGNTKSLRQFFVAYYAKPASVTCIGYILTCSPLHYFRFH